jgi:ribosomal protein L37AE/L43A
MVLARMAKRAITTRKAQRTCSFCGAHSDEVRRLIAGPGVFICDACVEVAAEVLDGRTDKTSERTRMVAVTVQQADARCSFCGDHSEDQAVAPDRPPAGKFGRRSGPVRICASCVALCDEILSEHAAG